MKNRYDALMKNIEVTPEMQKRILNNIKGVDSAQSAKKPILFSRYRKYISIAACFVILIAGSMIVQHIINMSDTPPVQTIPDIASYDAADELSRAVGFSVKEIDAPPFDVESVQYTSYWGNLAQIEYTGAKNTLVFRMASGSEDISGYYEEYAKIENHLVNGYNVTIKGHGDEYVIAVWQHDGFSYSLHFTESVSKQAILATIEKLQ